VTRFVQFLGQAIAYSLFAVVIGYFATRPAYTHHDPEKALIKISFSHAGAHIEPCIRLSQEELNRLPPNMRVPTRCPRERLPLLLEALIDGQLVYSEELPPSGLTRDGTSTVYARFPVAAGQHHLISVLNWAVFCSCEGTMVLIEWRDEFLVGIADVDHEHQELIALINKLHDAMSGDDASISVLDFLGEIYAHVSAHFALEEKIMRKRKYDGYSMNSAISWMTMKKMPITVTRNFPGISSAGLRSTSRQKMHDCTSTSGYERHPSADLVFARINRACKAIHNTNKHL